jgi:hypothetical protein
MVLCVWIHDFSIKLIVECQMNLSVIVINVFFFFFFFFALSSGHAHAVTQAVVVSQKILTENTGKRETGNSPTL